MEHLRHRLNIVLRLEITETTYAPGFMECILYWERQTEIEGSRVRRILGGRSSEGLVSEG